MAEQPKDDPWIRELESMRPALDRRFRSLRGTDRGPDLATSEVVQAAMARFVSYVRRLPGLRPEHLRRLLMRVLRNTAVDSFRRHRLRRRAFGNPVPGDAPGGPADAAPGGVEAAIGAEDRARLEAVLDSLVDADRELILLRRTHASWRTIAAHLGVTEEVARRRWSDLRRRIQSRMARDA